MDSHMFEKDIYTHIRPKNVVFSLIICICCQHLPFCLDFVMSHKIDKKRQKKKKPWKKETEGRIKQKKK